MNLTTMTKAQLTAALRCLYEAAPNGKAIAAAVIDGERIEKDAVVKTMLLVTAEIKARQ
jgi:hypothetical protein